MSDTAVTILVAGMLQLATIIAGVVTLWIRQQSIETHLEENTRLTRTGTQEASTNARAAAAVAVSARNAAGEAREAASEAADATREVKEKIGEVHTLVNSQRELMVKEIAELKLRIVSLGGVPPPAPKS